MPLTTEQIVKIRQKEASLADALKRDPLTNYREGYFFVTLNTQGKAPVLSSCVGRPGGEGADAPHCEYTELGQRVKEVIASIPNFHKSAEVIDAEVMPEHLHILLRLQTGGNEHLGKIISGFMSGCSHAYWDTLGIDWRRNHPTQAATSGQPAAIIRGAAAPQNPDRDRDHTRSFRGPALFVRGYNDVEPISEAEVQVKRKYIREQAEKRLIQGDRHECFRKYRHRRSQHWTLKRCMDVIAADRTFRHDAERREKAMAEVQARLIQDPDPRLDFVGNPALIGIGTLPDGTAARRLPLVCHSADAARFDEQKAAVMKAAREGWVIVSAFISPKEHDIKQQLMAEQLPIVEVTDNGFSERYKPGGRAFYACGENRLTQVSCWNYRHQRGGVRVSREMCLVMNELARVICGIADDWWKTLG